MALNPLANPKGVNLLCELCQKPAFVQCLKCRVTYYCGVEHQRADWLGIHEKICQQMIPLRTPLPFVSSEEERRHMDEQRLMRQMQMIEVTRTAGQKLLFEGKHEQSVPAALQSLRFAIEVHGLSSIELVPSYLILGEASIGLSRLSQAEEYLSQAQWTVLKTPDCPNHIKHKLYRNVGLLYASKGQTADALRSLADDIYHASYEYGTDAIQTSGGFFYMANVFFRNGNHKVVCCWYDHLKKLMAMKEEMAQNLNQLNLALQTDDDNGLDEAQEAEAQQVLNSIWGIRENDSNYSAIMKAKVAFTLALLYFLLNNIERAKEFGRKAIVTSEGIEDQEFTRNIVDFMKLCDNVP